MTRRSPALTKQARDLYEEAYGTGLIWHTTIEGIACRTGLTPDQVRDAIFAPSADEWRQGFYRRRQERLHK
jgi:hypothetical protein